MAGVKARRTKRTLLAAAGPGGPTADANLPSQPAAPRRSPRVPRQHIVSQRIEIARLCRR
jgi:hypothetical protein